LVAALFLSLDDSRDRLDLDSDRPAAGAGSGLEPGDLVLLGLTFIVASITFRSRRIQPLQGAVHLVIFAAFLLPTLVR
jgi:hypothetical protein